MLFWKASKKWIIILGIHPTFYEDKEGKREKSFHPFFYLKLYNEDNQEFGVIVQFINTQGAENEQVHLYEKNGVEFIEKNYSDFETELKLIFRRIIRETITNINQWLICFKSFEIPKLTLADFFKTALPEKGEFVQEKLRGLQKTCVHFCILAVQRLGLRKKAKSIEKVKSKMEKVLNEAKGAKSYNRYVEGFNTLFQVITGQ